MCVRICPLTFEEAQAVLDARGSGLRARVLSDNSDFDPVHDAHPGSTVAAYVPARGGTLVVARLEWGFPMDGKQHAVFNTRIESALEQLRRGRCGMWAKAIANGRCLVPVRAFYESSATEKVTREKTGKQVRRQYRFRLPGARAFLLAAIHEEGHFSIVTTKSNASVAPVHDRMPLVLGHGESGMWFGPGFASLTDRSGICFLSEPECQEYGAGGLTSMTPRPSRKVNLP